MAWFTFLKITTAKQTLECTEKIKSKIIFCSISFNVITITIILILNLDLGLQYSISFKCHCNITTFILNLYLRVHITKAHKHVFESHVKLFKESILKFK